MICIGVTNFSPKQILDFLIAKSLIASASNVHIVKQDSTLPEKLKKKYLFVLSSADFMHNLSILNSDAYRNTKVFVFASQITLLELKGCSIIDIDKVIEDPILFNLGSRLSLPKVRAALQNSSEIVVKQTIRYMNALVDGVVKGSLLTPLMTFIYTLSRATQQTPTKENIALYIAGFQNIDKLYGNLEGVISEKNLEKMQSILDLPIVNEYRKAFLELKAVGSVKRVKEVSMKYAVPEYEIRYILSVVEAAKIKLKAAKNERSQPRNNFKLKAVRHRTNLAKH